MLLCVERGGLGTLFCLEIDKVSEGVLKTKAFLRTGESTFRWVLEDPKDKISKKAQNEDQMHDSKAIMSSHSAGARALAY